MGSGSRTARAVARLAFGPAAALYEALTSDDAWRGDCREMAAFVPGPRVLDVGVGPGTSAIEMARAAPDRRHVGLDLSPRMLRRASRRARDASVPLPLVRGDALRLPFRDATFDGATGHSVLYLLADTARALAEIRRVVRPGGRVAFLEPAAGPGSLGRALEDGGARHAVSMALWRGMSCLHRRFDEPGLLAALIAAGFEEARAWPVLAGYGIAATAVRPAVDGAARSP